jgi:hypothetical protein
VGIGHERSLRSREIGSVHDSRHTLGTSGRSDTRCGTWRGNSPPVWVLRVVG